MRKGLFLTVVATIIIASGVSIAAATTVTPPEGGTWTYSAGDPCYSNYYQD